jgi:hypothetical protein
MTDVVWLHHALPRTAWYELDPAARAELTEAWNAARQRSLAAGARTEGSYNVRGQSDYSTVEVWFFPEVQDAFAHWARLVDAGYAQWFEAANSVGTSVERS